MILSPGFYIKAFEARGAEVVASRVDFDASCNVIVGKSDTGKTTLFRLLEFVLGKTGDVKLSSEWAGYTQFFVEIHTAKYETYTLMRKTGENVVLVKQCTITEFLNVTNNNTYGIGANAKVNISDFLLQLGEVKDAFFKAYEKKRPFRLSYSMIRHLFFVDEVRISSDEPSFYAREKNSNSMLYQNQFAYLMTGEDDRTFVPAEEKKVAQSRVNGIIEYLKEEIANLLDERDSIGDVDYISMGDKSFIDTYRSKLSSVSDSLDSLYERQRNVKAKISLLEGEMEELSFFINRLGHLKGNYELELQRLEFINQGTEYLTSLTGNTCPICGTELDEHHILNIEHSKYKEALQQEYANTKFKLNDISGLIAVKKKELEEKLGRLGVIRSEENNIQSEIDRITPNYDILTQMISNAEANLKKRMRFNQLKELIERKEKEQKDAEALLAEIGRRKTKKEEEKDYINDQYLAALKDVLMGFNFIKDEDEVSFSLQDFDITVNGKSRATYGKGNRAITCTAALLSLMDFLISKERNISRLIVLDSPVCTKYDGNSDDSERPDDHVLDAFAKYCNDKEWPYQVIIMDNKIDSSEQIDKTKYPNIHFVEFGTEERPGLFLTRLEGDKKKDDLEVQSLPLF